MPSKVIITDLSVAKQHVDGLLELAKGDVDRVETVLRRCLENVQSEERREEYALMLLALADVAGDPNIRSTPVQ